MRSVTFFPSGTSNLPWVGVGVNGVSGLRAAGTSCHGDRSGSDSSECRLSLNTEPVPQPRIRSQLLASTLEGCNVTLQCQGSGKGNVSISWGKGNPVQELDPARHQLSPDGRTLQLSVLPSSWNATYTCTVSNPVDQKIVSFDLQSICRSGGEGLVACLCVDGNT